MFLFRFMHPPLLVPWSEIKVRRNKGWIFEYDGSPVLKLSGCFMAGLATHPSAEPDTLVIRVGCEEREWLIKDAPETYYLTDHYRSYPLLLVRLSRVDRDALHDLLSVSW